jgi:predicted ferric reductase
MSTKTKRLQRYMVGKIMVLEGNLEQTAEMDTYLARETLHRAAQFKYLRAGDTEAAHKQHDERVACLEKALEVLRACPVCEPDPKDPSEPSEP